MKLGRLITQIKKLDASIKHKVGVAINSSLTLRNWIIGAYIVEYEQNGEDRAEYGKYLLQNIASNIQIKGLTAPELSRCRQLYKTYPFLISILNDNSQILGSLNQEFDKEISIIGSLTQKSQPTDSDIRFATKLVATCSFTHFVELIKITDPTKRKFYELLIIKTTPSVRELKKQISTLAFERVGLSGDNKAALSELEQKIEPQNPTDIVKSHYFLDFLNFNNPGLVEETELENALINHLSDFILELGNGFCFEARQKRILIGDKYYFIDLVFYHRILRCHVLIDLKVGDFEHANAGQLNTYINFYTQNIQQEYDNPPVGILMVTDKDRALVEYATAGMDENLFVSKYLLQLPNKKDLESFIKSELEKL